MSSRTIRIGVTLFALLFPSLATGQGLHQAIQAGDVDQVKSLLREGADPNEVGPRGLSAGELGFKAFVDRFRPRAIALLDPGRREERYPDVAEMVRSWGYEGEVFTARHPGDVFRFTRSGASE